MNPVWVASLPPPSAPVLNTYRLMDGVSGRPGVGSSGTQPPASSTAFGGVITVGTAFGVTQGAMYLQGFWWYRADSSQSGSAQSFCLWQVSPSGGLLVPGSQITSGALSIGWNYVPYLTPLALTPNASYKAQTGFSGNFPGTTNQFATGNPYSAGITNGPLTAYSAQSGSNPFPAWLGAATIQGSYSSATADPTAVYASSDDDSFNCWLDVQVTDAVPPGSSYRLWPNHPVGSPLLSIDTNGYTIATEFALSQPCALNAIWWYSPPGAADLPTRCVIWNVGTQLAVAGTDNTSPSWSGAAGSGWIKVPYDGSVILPAGKYKTSVFHPALGNAWFADIGNYWLTGGYPGVNGITNGPLSAPNAAASTTGQSSYHITTFAYPATDDGGANDWTDVEVTPV